MEKADIERALFYYLCREDIADKMTQLEPMSYEEFDMIIYILMALKFYDLLMEFWDTFYDQFRENIEESNSRYFIENFDMDIKKCEKWLYEFSDHAPTKELQVILREIFEIS